MQLYDTRTESYTIANKKVRLKGLDQSEVVDYTYSCDLQIKLDSSIEFDSFNKKKKHVIFFLMMKNVWRLQAKNTI